MMLRELTGYPIPYAHLRCPRARPLTALERTRYSSGTSMTYGHARGAEADYNGVSEALGGRRVR
jgi:hypothetical protein